MNHRKCFNIYLRNLSTYKLEYATEYWQKKRPCSIIIVKYHKLFMFERRSCLLRVFLSFGVINLTSRKSYKNLDFPYHQFVLKTVIERVLNF